MPVSIQSCARTQTFWLPELPPTLSASLLALPHCFPAIAGLPLPKVSGLAKGAHGYLCLRFSAMHRGSCCRAIVSMSAATSSLEPSLPQVWGIPWGARSPSTAPQAKALSPRKRSVALLGSWWKRTEGG